MDEKEKKTSVNSPKSKKNSKEQVNKKPQVFDLSKRKPPFIIAIIGVFIILSSFFLSIFIRENTVIVTTKNTDNNYYETEEEKQNNISEADKNVSLYKSRTRTETYNINKSDTLQSIEYGGAFGFSRVSMDILPGWSGTIENSLNKFNEIFTATLSLSYKNEKDQKFVLSMAQGGLSGAPCLYPGEIIENENIGSRVTEFEEYIQIKDQDGNYYRRAKMLLSENAVQEGFYQICRRDLDADYYGSPTDVGRINFLLPQEEGTYEYIEDENILEQMDHMISSIKIVAQEDNPESCASSKVYLPVRIDCENIVKIDAANAPYMYQGGIGDIAYNKKFIITILPGYRIEYIEKGSTHTTNIISIEDENYVLTISQADRSGWSCLYSDKEKLPEYGVYKKYKEFVEITNNDNTKYRRSNEGLYLSDYSGNSSDEPENTYRICSPYDGSDSFSTTTKYGDILYTITTDENEFDINSVKEKILNEMDKMVASLAEIN